MRKDLQLVGKTMSIGAADGDIYLETMPADGPFDLEQVFAQFCRTNSNFIDVGANIGITATIAGLLVSPGLVLALEPVPEAFAYLSENISNSGLTNVQCFNMAAASTEGEVNLVFHPGHNFAAFVGYDDVLDRYTGYAETTIRAVSLDQLVQEQGLDHVDFIKIDVEGYELEVLRGATRLLEEFHPVVFLEANNYCLNIFRRVSLVDFTEEVLSIFPVVYAVDTTFEFLDLSDASTHSNFFHENVVQGRFPNLLCGFNDDIRQGLAHLTTQGRVVSDSPAPAPLDVGGAGAEPVRQAGPGVRRRLRGLLRSHPAPS
jgi:FkbM family methyltransferase